MTSAILLLRYLIQVSTCFLILKENLYYKKVECSNKIYSTLQTSVRLTMSLEILAKTCMFGTVKSFYTLAKRTVKAERCVSPVSLNQGPEVLTKWLMLSPFLGSSRGTALLI